MQPIIDPGYLQYVSGGDIAFELELLSTFVEDIGPHLVQLVRGVDTHPASLSSPEVLDVVQREAHYIKGASGNVGARIMFCLAEQLEAQAQQAQTDTLRYGAEALVAAFEDVKQVQASRAQSASASL